MICSHENLMIYEKYVGEGSMMYLRIVSQVVPQVGSDLLLQSSIFGSVNAYLTVDRVLA